MWAVRRADSRPGGARPVVFSQATRGQSSGRKSLSGKDPAGYSAFLVDRKRTNAGPHIAAPKPSVGATGRILTAKVTDARNASAPAAGTATTDPPPTHNPMSMPSGAGFRA